MEALPISYNAAISACEKGGEWVKALELLSTMVQDKVEVNTITYNAAISAYERSGRAAEAIALGEKMEAAGVAATVLQAGKDKLTKVARQREDAQESLTSALAAAACDVDVDAMRTASEFAQEAGSPIDDIAAAEQKLQLDGGRRHTQHPVQHGGVRGGQKAGGDTPAVTPAVTA